MKIEGPCYGTENVPRLRDAQLQFKEGYTPITFEHGTLRFLGKTKGFSLRMVDVENDPYILEELLFLYGGKLPAKWRGYTRSGATSEALRRGILAYDHEYPMMPKDLFLEQAINHAFVRFHFGVKVKPLSHWDVPLESNTSAGWTWAGKKKSDVYRSAVYAAMRQTSLAKQGRLSKRGLPPCMGFKRTQLATIDKKRVRLVWGFPIEMTIREGRFAVPIVDLYEYNDSPIFHGKTMLKELPAFIDSMFVNDGKAFVTDWSGFDATVPPWLIKIAFAIVRQSLDLSKDEEIEFWSIVDYFIRTPIVMNDGETYLKTGGIPSGSYWTQVIGSICNFIISSYLQLKTLGRFCKCRVLGDDLVGRLRPEESVDFAEWTEIARREFNMKISTSKSILATKPEECDFLGHSANAGRVLRDEDRLVLLALYPEYPVETPEISTSRILGLLLDSGFRSPHLWTIYKNMEYKYGVAEMYHEKFLQHVVGLDKMPPLRSTGSIWIHTGA